MISLSESHFFHVYLIVHLQAYWAVDRRVVAGHALLPYCCLSRRLYSLFLLPVLLSLFGPVTAASRPVSPMSAGFGESAEDLESHIQTQVWLEV